MIYKILSLSTLLFLVASCSVTIPPSLDELEKSEEAKVQSIRVNQDLDTTSKIIWQHMQKCMNYKYSFRGQYGSLTEWLRTPKVKNISKHKKRIYLEVKKVDYSLFSDEVPEFFYGLRLDVNRISNHKTLVNIRDVGYDEWADALADRLKGNKEAFCPYEKLNEW